MRMRLCLLLVLLALAAQREALAGEGLVIDPAQTHVDITTNFAGAQVVLYGLKPGAGPVAVVISGPRHPVTVRRKEPLLGAWLNRSAVTFEDVPTFYDYAVSPGLSAQDLAGAGIGVTALPLRVSYKNVGQEDVAAFRQALIERAQQRGLYPAEARAIVPLTDRFFKAVFDLPPNVPVGDYHLEAHYYDYGEVAEKKVAALRVAQVGMSARIHAFAVKDSLLYGIFCVTLGLFAGWISNRIRSRN